MLPQRPQREAGARRGAGLQQDGVGDVAALVGLEVVAFLRDVEAPKVVELAFVTSEDRAVRRNAEARQGN